MDINSDEKSVVVIGAGIVGLSVALKLHSEGYKITIIDRNEPMEGCSAGNAGFLSESNIFPPATKDILLKLPGMLISKQGPLIISPTYLNRMLPWTLKAAATLNKNKFDKIVDAFSSLITRSQTALHQLSEISGSRHFITSEGGLVCFITEEAFQARIAKIPLWREKGISVRVMDAQETREMEPDLTENVVGSLFFGNSGRCSNPQGLGLSYFSYLIENGVKFIRDKINNIQSDNNNNWIVDGELANYTASNVICCAGYHSETLLSKFKIKRNVVSERGYHLMLPDSGVNLNRPIVFGEPYFAATPMEHGLRLAGTAEFASPDLPANYGRATMLKDLAKKYLPHLNTDNAVPWMGIRPTLPDGLPAIGEISGHRGLFYAYGHGHNGLMTSAITAECVASLIGRRESPVDLQPFSITRFS
ncbi:NAD(P)/FAD-dependent oxidoreductase [Pantoea endophytica]|uniref:NAD(P)/FAD-dependent oxidoreductase n=1 Tax=Pantoea endophytica TaxID=92488 RepID=UPI002412E9E0|nr:FAD-dependent oxidoreductase [Pantoea endophytica]